MYHQVHVCVSSQVLDGEVRWQMSSSMVLADASVSATYAGCIQWAIGDMKNGDSNARNRNRNYICICNYAKIKILYKTTPIFIKIYKSVQ